MAAPPPNLVQKVLGVFNPLTNALLGLTTSGEAPYFPVVAVGGLTPQTFTTTLNQTIFTLAGAPTAVSSVIVSLSGVLLYPGIDFNLSGVTLTLTNPTPAGRTLYVAYATSGAATMAQNDVRVYGADASGVFDSSGAFTSDAGAQLDVLIPAGNYLIASNPIIGQALLHFQKGVTLTGAGAASLLQTLTAGNEDIQVNTAGTDFATHHVRRQVTHSGGTPGSVAAAFRADSFVGANATNYEWTIVGVNTNSATGGQNVAIYGQGNQQTSTTGPTWAGVMEVIDHSGQVNPTNAIVGLEVDCRANGADSNSNRVPLHIVASRPTGGGADATIDIAVLIDNNNDGVHTSYGQGIFFGNKTGGTCNFTTGINMTGGAYSSAAIWLPAGAPILFDTPGVNQLYFDGSRMRYDTVVSSVRTLQFSVAAGGFAALGPVINNGSAALLTTTTNMSGANEQSLLLNDTFNGTGTNAGMVVNSNIATGVTSTIYDAILIQNPTLIGGASISGVCVGVQVNAMSSGSGGNRAISLNNAAAATNYNVYAIGTAQNIMGGPLGVNGATPPAKVTGFGTPTGTGVIANFPGATATLAQCSQAIAQLITDIKNFGLYGT